MFTYIKDPADTVIGIGIDFSSRLQTSETIADFTIDDAGAGMANSERVNGNTVLANLTGGVIGQTYTITYSMTGSLGTTATGQVQVIVAKNGGVCTISANVRSLGLAPAAGIEFKAQIHDTPTVSNGRFITSQILTSVTDLNGYVSFDVPQFTSVKITSSVLKVPFTVNTEGSTGIDLSSLL